MPGTAETIKNLIVNENGVISTLTSADINGIDDNGSPWYMKGHLLMSGQFTIGALMKNLDSAATGGVYGYYDQAGDRVIVTYSGSRRLVRPSPTRFRSWCTGAAR